MIDTAKITVKAGDGGDGLASFRREKFIAKGGPWGGDGGKGGNIILIVDPHLNTLTSFRRQRHYKAQSGQKGMRNRKKGKDGLDLFVKVPPGTTVYDNSGNILYDLTKVGQQIVIAKGGEGGLGNWHFKSSVNQAPTFYTPGDKGEEKTLKLELKLIADVGLIGLPSSGKSTLLNALTRASVKTAKYPFTTLEPNLGVMGEIVLADIPGLIEGAAKGRGLGHDFLRHIERTKVLIHLIDGADILAHPVPKLTKNYKIIQKELENWNKELLKKPQIVVINKIDLSEVTGAKNKIIREFKKYKITPLFISATANIGLDELVNRIINELSIQHARKSGNSPTSHKPTKVYTINNLPNKRIVFRKSPQPTRQF